MHWQDWTTNALHLLQRLGWVIVAGLGWLLWLRRRARPVLYLTLAATGALLRVAPVYGPGSRERTVNQTCWKIMFDADRPLW